MTFVNQQSLPSISRPSMFAGGLKAAQPAFGILSLKTVFDGIDVGLRALVPRSVQRPPGRRLLSRRRPGLGLSGVQFCSFSLVRIWVRSVRFLRCHDRGFAGLATATCGSSLSTLSTKVLPIRPQVRRAKLMPSRVKPMASSALPCSNIT
jgi:hypothetical protein